MWRNSIFDKQAEILFSHHDLLSSIRNLWVPISFWPTSFWWLHCLFVTIRGSFHLVAIPLTSYRSSVIFTGSVGLPFVLCVLLSFECVIWIKRSEVNRKLETVTTFTILWNFWLTDRLLTKGKGRNLKKL